MVGSIDLNQDKCFTCAMVVKWSPLMILNPRSNPEWGPIYYEASITAQGLPEPSFLGIVHRYLNS